GTPTQSLLNEVDAVLAEKFVRPLTDEVIVQGAQILSYIVDAKLEFYTGPDPDVVLAEAKKRVEEYTNACHRLKDTATLSGLYAALHQPGVKKVHLNTPVDDVEALSHQAPYCTKITVEKL
ncbi:MAG: baseplate assembly protein, partial [Desulfobacteraceae bacterium]|nr:baseplate assembly protein [Desulfobacteraceae bacterium]